jgi:hypothetical protein
LGEGGIGRQQLQVCVIPERLIGFDVTIATLEYDVGLDRPLFVPPAGGG